jgi:hypothetical protein
MSTSGPPPPSPHRIAILMLPVGRFLECRSCQLSFEFPAGARYDVIAKQFGPLCGSDDPSRAVWSKVFRPEPSSQSENVKPHRTERRFVIVRYEGKVPAMASCTKCQRKFFAPATFARDASGAEQYLGRKFDVHNCPETIEERDRRRLF